MFAWPSFQTDVAESFDDAAASCGFSVQDARDEEFCSMRRYRAGELWLEVSWESKEALLQLNAGYRYRVRDWLDTIVGPPVDEWLRILGLPPLPHEQRFSFRSTDGLGYRQYVLRTVSTCIPDIVGEMRASIDEIDAGWRSKFPSNFFIEKQC